MNSVELSAKTSYQLISQEITSREGCEGGGGKAAQNLGRRTSVMFWGIRTSREEN